MLGSAENKGILFLLGQPAHADGVNRICKSELGRDWVSLPLAAPHQLEQEDFKAGLHVGRLLLVAA